MENTVTYEWQYKGAPVAGARDREGVHMNITASLFNRMNPNQDFSQLVNYCLNRGQSEHELALMIKDEWLHGADARYEDVLRDIRQARCIALGHVL